MKKIIFLIICLLLTAKWGETYLFARPVDSKKFDKIIENNSFHVGEKLTFGIYYQFIRVGSAVMEIVDSVEIDSFKTIQIQTRARSAGFFDAFYKVRDEINSYVDTQGYFSRKFTKRIHEGSYYVDVDIFYHYAGDSLSGRFRRFSDYEKKNVRQKDSKNFNVRIEEPVFDVLASFYLTRLKNIEPGMPVNILSNDNDKIYPIIIYIQGRESVKTNAGRFRTFAIVPKLRGEAIFKQKGQLKIWLTDDQYKIPVKVESELYFGSIYIELEKIEGHQLPLPSQRK